MKASGRNIIHLAVVLSTLVRGLGAAVATASTSSIVPSDDFHSMIPKRNERPATSIALEEPSTHSTYSLWYCFDESCANPFLQANNDEFEGLNWCDTLYGYKGDEWPIYMDKIMFWSDNADLVVQLFEGDYCTGVQANVPYWQVGSGGGDGNMWFSVGQNVKSVRVYNLNDFPKGEPGIGVKLVFFPWTGMQPYNEFTCTKDSCGDSNNDCNQLDGLSSPTSGGPDGNCVSSDDLIWGLSEDSNVAMVPITEYLDFAGNTCGSGDAYICSFADYPIGSIYLGLWFSTANGQYYGDDFQSGSMESFCTASGDSKVDSIRSSCVYTRMWKSDTFNIGSTPHWDQYPYVQTVSRVADLCDIGQMYSICDNQDDTFTSGGPMYYFESESDAYVYGGDSSSSSSKPVTCDEDGLWPLWTSYIANVVLPCHSSTEAEVLKFY